jgi:hypothetical protein
MPSRSFQKDVFKSPERLKRLKSQNNKRYINGQLTNFNSKEFKVQNAAEILRSNGVLGAKPDSTYANTPDVALSVLQALGISVMNSKDRKFSFSKTQNNNTRGLARTDHASAPSSSDPSQLKFAQLKNKKVSAIKSFKSADNPFYNIDDAGISKGKYQQQKAIKQMNEYTNSTNLAAAFYDFNIGDRSTPALGQFR